jgi:chromosome segregation ATPase
MTPQEIERTLEFIVEHQAQASVHIQQASVHIQQVSVNIQRLSERQGKMQSMMELMTELAEVQSQRLDRHDETFRSLQAMLQKADGSLQSMQSWQREALSRLDQILERLTRDR